MKPKILIDAISLLSPLTGIGRYTYEISERLRRLDNDHEYLYYYGYTSHKLILSRVETKNRAETYLLGKARRILVKNPFVKKISRKIITVLSRITAPEVNLYWQPNFIPSPGIRTQNTIISVHDFSFLHHPQWHPKELVEHFAMNFIKGILRADRIITGSEYTKKEIVGILGYDPARIDVIYHGVNHEIFRTLDPAEQKTSAPLPERYILAVGSIEPRKNLTSLLMAYSILPLDIKKRYKLVLAGPQGWNNKEIRQMIEKDMDHIVLLGYLSDQDLCVAYNLASIFIYPSFYEGFGIPPLEAMACGTPVIASNTSSIPEVCGNCALYIDPKNYEELSDKIEFLLKKDELRQILRLKGQERARLFSWEKSAFEHLQAFNKILRT